MKNKTQTNENQMLTLLQSIVSRMDAIETRFDANSDDTTLDVPNVKASGKKAKKVSKGLSEKAKAYKAKMQGIQAAREEAQDRTLPEAIKLATAQIIHNEKRGFVNEKITNQKSLRRFLESREHQALKAVRDNTETSPSTIEEMLNASYAKAAKKAAKV